MQRPRMGQQVPLTPRTLRREASRRKKTPDPTQRRLDTYFSPQARATSTPQSGAGGAEAAESPAEAQGRVLRPRRRPPPEAVESPGMETADEDSFVSVGSEEDSELADPSYDPKKNMQIAEKIKQMRQEHEKRSRPTYVPPYRDSESEEEDAEVAAATKRARYK